MLSDRAVLNMNTAYRLTGPRGGGEGAPYNIIAPLLDADYIINVPKLKTHSFMTLTLGVKNLMGAVPGLQKPQLHARFHNKNDFASMLIDVAAIVAPQLTIVDAIDCMEGNGPSAGTKRHLGLTLASRDLFTQDWYIAKLIGVSPSDVPTIALSEKRSLTHPDDIDLRGDEVLNIEVPFILPEAAKPNFASGIFNFIGKPAMYIANKMSAPRPVLNGVLCTGCGKCAESCPPKIISITSGKAVFANKGCIACFCCQEMCPEKAIEIKRRLNI
jgi:ferredoxin